jgi:hypothetical protein
MANNKVLFVEGKHCPKCKNFVYKDGGCPQMVCRCGQLFCWYCAKPGYSHPDRRGCVTEQREREMTTTVIVRHHASATEDANSNQQARAAPRRQRVSLMERAVEHKKRQEFRSGNNNAVTVLAKAVATAAAKSNTVAQHVLKVCGVVPDSDFPSPLSSTSNPFSSFAPIHEHVKTFLRGVVRSKQELHELIEHTLVLAHGLPDTQLRRRLLRVTEDLGAFCSFLQSALDVWSGVTSPSERQQGAVRAVTRVAEIMGWIHAALFKHRATVTKIRADNTQV